MRQDLAKVICEKERTGHRAYMPVKGYEKRQRSHNADDYADEHTEYDHLPSYESMQKRLLGETRTFSENLGALRGLIAKNVGKNWDKIYSAICKLVSPTGTNIERHVHQHLPDFIHAQTRMGERGVELLAKYRRTWEPLATFISYRNREEFYVHPITRCIVKLKKLRKSARKPEEVTRVIIDKRQQLHKLKGIWFLIETAPIPKEALVTTTQKRALSRSNIVFYSELKRIVLPSRDILVPPQIDSSGTAPLFYWEAKDLEKVYGPGVYGLKKLGANHRTLKRHGLAA